MHYERGAKKILRFFREEFHKVRFQKIEERPRGGGEVRQRRRADLDDLRRVERQDAHAARKGAAIERVVHGEAETGLDHRVGRKGIHRGKFEIRRDAAARENARVEDFANSFGDSGSAATSVLVAQNRGAGKEERVKESFRSSLFLMLAMGLAMSLIMYVSASTSVGFMLGTRSGAAFENARDYLKLVALFYTLCFTGSTFAGYFNGIGKVSVPFLGATSHIALRVVLSWLLVGKMGLPAVALATGLGWVLVNALWTVIKWGMERKVKMQTVKKSK